MTKHRGSVCDIRAYADEFRTSRYRVPSFSAFTEKTGTAHFPLFPCQGLPLPGLLPTCPRLGTHTSVQRRTPWCP